MKKGIFKEQGQTLIEVSLVALIFLLVMSSLVTVHLYLLRSQKVATAQTQAAQLAREGIELVRGIRDSNWLAYNPDWLAGLSVDHNLPVENARVEWEPATGNAVLNFNITDIADAPLYQHSDQSGGYWNYNPAGGQVTGFYRLVTLEKITDGSSLPPAAFNGADKIVGLKVTAKVQWPGTGGTKDYQLVDYLYNWK